MKEKMKKKKVVVIGGGFAGSYCARRLERDFEVTLVDSEDYFEFIPGVPRTIVEPEHLGAIQRLHIDYLLYARVVRGGVTNVSEKEVMVGKERYAYDYLIVCSGSHYEAPFKEREVVSDLRGRHLRSIHDQVIAAKKVLVIGGGLVGVEIAAELAGHFKDKEITVVHAHGRLMERLPERASKLAYSYLSGKGVRIILNERVEKNKGGYYWLSSHTSLTADLVFLCVGITPNYSFLKGFDSVLDEHHHLKVTDFLQVHGYPRLFSAGDITSLHVEKTAQNAQKQAAVVVHNIYALERGGKMKAYVSRKTPIVLSLGKYNGLFIYKDFVFGGIVPGFMKWAIEKKEMWKK
ncbi:MAG TPA: FAD-dependent oxidoreductase [Candidatus Nanoarchaeia archaeon]|nr:FAD-dependent oxidoreductase [Candidatus Nanoarchaeia archaeon]